MYFSYAAYAFLGLALILAFTATDRLKPLALYAVSFALALFGGLLTWLAALSVAAIGGLSFLVFRKPLKRPLRLVLMALLLVVGHLVMTHLLPGFDNLKALSGVQVSEGGIPYSMYLNFDKATLGFFLVLFAVKPDTSWQVWTGYIKSALLFFAPAAVVLIALAYLAGLVTLDVKLPAFLPIWIASNLLITCVAEEMFFRRFVLGEVRDLLGTNWIAVATALAVSSLFFAYYHLNGGPLYAAFSLVAGLCYGAAYLKSGRVEVAILVHFLVNLTHILLFTYPFLASSVGLN